MQHMLASRRGPARPGPLQALLCSGQEVEADVPHAVQVHLGLARHTKLSYLVGIGMRNALAQEPKPTKSVSPGSLSGRLWVWVWLWCGLPVCGAYLLNHLSRVPLAQVT